MYDFVKDVEQMFENARNRTEQKKKVREIMADYGETLSDIENNAPESVYWEFMLAGGKEVLEQVQLENAQERLNAANPQTPTPEAATENPDYTASNKEDMPDNRDDLANEICERDFGDECKRDFGDECKRKRPDGIMTPIKQFNQDAFMKIMKPIIKKNEGIVLHPYVDTADKSTIGPGTNIDSDDTGVEYNLLDPKTNKLTPLDPTKEKDKAIIEEELAKLEPYKNGNKRSADFFKDKTNLRITEKNADALYRRNVEKFIKNINNIIDDFNDNLGKTEGYIDRFERLPENLQIVLIDMVYNLGAKKFNWKQTPNAENPTKKDGYPTFWKHLANRNIDGMVKECLRNENDKGFANRNKETQDLIRKTPENWTKNRLKK
ncbi:MAG: pesticin C-terminus-like muramidase [Acetobacter sp.]|nr:pesticin C-terminus-like muramidase [Acetobacter sp.]